MQGDVNGFPLIVHMVVPLCAVISLAATGIATWTALAVKSAIKDAILATANARILELQERAADKDETRRWINGSFMRAKEAEGQLTSLHDDLKAIRCTLSEVFKLFNGLECKNKGGCAHGN